MKNAKKISPYTRQARQEKVEYTSTSEQLLEQATIVQHANTVANDTVNYNPTLFNTSFNDNSYNLFQKWVEGFNQSFHTLINLNISLSDELYQNNIKALDLFLCATTYAEIIAQVNHNSSANMKVLESYFNNLMNVFKIKDLTI